MDGIFGGKKGHQPGMELMLVSNEFAYAHGLQPTHSAPGYPRAATHLLLYCIRGGLDPGLALVARGSVNHDFFLVGPAKLKKDGTTGNPSAIATELVAAGRTESLSAVQVCKAGTYKNKNQSGVCTQCPAGFFSDSEHAEECMACTSGSFTGFCNL